MTTSNFDSNIGTIATAGGAAVGASGGIGAVSAMGSVGGLGAAGITSGLAAVGGVVGGGMLTGLCLVAAAPILAGGAAFGAYKLYSKLSK